MPKVVNHDERRRRIARATWQVVTRDGVRGATVRTVAAEAGLSVGALRHYFDDHASLILFASTLSVELIGERIRTEIARADNRDPIEVAVACLEQLLPLDPQRVSETAVYFGLIDETRLRPDYREFREVSFRLARRLYRQLVTGIAGPEVPAWDDLVRDESRWDRPLADPSLETEAWLLQLVVDGLAVDGLLLPNEIDADTIRATLRGQLQRIRA